MFNLLLQLCNDIVDVVLLQRHRDKFDILAPDGWTDPPVRRTHTSTSRQDGPHLPQHDNNNTSTSQVNVQDVRSIP